MAINWHEIKRFMLSSGTILLLFIVGMLAVTCMGGCESWFSADFRGQKVTESQLDAIARAEAARIQREQQDKAEELAAEIAKTQREYEQQAKAADRRAEAERDEVDRQFADKAAAHQASLARLPRDTKQKVADLGIEVQRTRDAIDEKVAALSFVGTGLKTAGDSGLLGPFGIGAGVLGGIVMRSVGSRKRHDQSYEEGRAAAESEASKRDAAWDASQADLMKLMLAMSGKSLPAPGATA